MKTRKTIEFGDFQTPASLAGSVCRLLAKRGHTARSVIEPTCGKGQFLFAALAQFPGIQKAVALDINPEHIAHVISKLNHVSYVGSLEILHGDFFDTDWRTILAGLPEPILIIGNPPWVTNADLGVLGSSNLPEKTNLQNHDGIDALTGKSNFDISEWIIMKVLELLNGRDAVVAMLCKTSVARKVLAHAWKSEISLLNASLYAIDAPAHFGATVSACLLACQTSRSGGNRKCQVYAGLEMREPAEVIGYQDGMIIANITKYEKFKNLKGDEIYKWRSGIKHDCSSIMELREEGDRYRNGLGACVQLEDEYIYPMLKSSDIASGRVVVPRRWMVVPQRFVGEDTGKIAKRAPNTWKYLQSHAEMLNGRKSRIYRKRPQFSIFGVGDYSFSPWKVAISGLSKRLRFRKLGTHLGKPIVLDDSCYFVSCHSEREADCIEHLLSSSMASDFYESFLFWDAKRPITVDLLRKLDLMRLADALGKRDQLRLLLESGKQGRIPVIPQPCRR
jgi:hypothetical protein